jgi:hypothetical protein
MNNLPFIKFTNWLSQSDNRWDPRYKRAETITNLLFRNIIPMLNRQGYHLCYNKQEMRNKFATWLYTIDKEYYYDNAHILIVPQALHRDEQIDRDNWDLTFDHNVWYKISQNDAWSEILHSEFGKDFFWATLSQFIYRYIDVVNSPKVKAYDAEEAALEQAEYEWMVEQGLIVEKKKGGDDIVDKPGGKYWD